MARLANAGVLCLYGAEDADSECAALPDGRYLKAQLPGGHHFGGNYAELARRILQAVPAPVR
jgi:type IV secretory pathway VirJ component